MDTGLAGILELAKASKLSVSENLLTASGLEELQAMFCCGPFRGSIGATARKYWLRSQAKLNTAVPPRLKPLAKTLPVQQAGWLVSICLVTINPALDRSTHVCCSTHFQIASTMLRSRCCVSSIAGHQKEHASFKFWETNFPCMQHSSESHKLEQHCRTPPMEEASSSCDPHGKIPNHP